MVKRKKFITTGNIAAAAQTTKAVSGNVQPARFQYMTIAGKAKG